MKNDSLKFKGWIWLSKLMKFAKFTDFKPQVEGTYNSRCLNFLKSTNVSNKEELFIVTHDFSWLLNFTTSPNVQLAFIDYKSQLKAIKSHLVSHSLLQSNVLTRDLLKQWLLWRNLCGFVLKLSHRVTIEKPLKNEDRNFRNFLNFVGCGSVQTWNG